MRPGQQTTLEANTDIAHGFAPYRGASGALPPIVRTAGPFYRVDETNYGKALPCSLNQEVGLLQAQAYTSSECPTCSVLIGYTKLNRLEDSYAFPVARVKMGVAGHAVEFFCDVPIGGTILNLPASMVEVSVMHPSIPVAIVAGTNPAAEIRAWAMLGVHGGVGRPGSSNPARLTVFVATIISNATQIVQIPPLAQSYQLGVRTDPAFIGGLQVSQSASPVNNIPLFTNNVPAGQPSNTVGGAIPIVDGAQALFIKNNDPANDQAPTVVFYLSC